MKNNKYQLTDETRVMEDGTVVYRIEALQDINPRHYMSFGSNKVKAGELGGFVESEDNLSFVEGDTAWINDDAVAKEGSKVEKDSVLYGRSVIKGSSLLTNGSTAYGDAKIKNSVLDDTSVDYTVYRKNENNELEIEDLIVNSKIEKSNIEDGSSIIDSHVLDTNVNTASHILNSTLIDTYISGSDVINTHAEKSRLGIHTKVVNSKIENSNIVEDVDGQYIKNGHNWTVPLTGEDLADLVEGKNQKL